MLVNNVNNYNIGNAEIVFFKVLKSSCKGIYTTCIQLTTNKNKQKRIYFSEKLVNCSL